MTSDTKQKPTSLTLPSTFPDNVTEPEPISSLQSDTTSNAGSGTGISSTTNNTTNNNNNIYVVLYDYVAQHEDELNLVKYSKVKVLSKDFKISGDEGWWTGVSLNDNKRGIFPFNYVGTASQLTKEVVAQSISSSIRKINRPKRSDSRELPPHIPFDTLEFKDCIGAGGFGKVFRGFWTKIHNDKKKYEQVAIKEARVEGKNKIGRILFCL